MRNPVLSRHQGWRRLLEAATKDGTPERFFDDFGAALQSNQVDPVRDLRLRYLFEEFVEDGMEIVRSWDPRSGGMGPGGGNGAMILGLQEDGFVSTANFAMIMGQITYSMVMQEYAKPVYLAEMLTTNQPTQFNGEKIPGMGEIGDAAEEIAEGKPYPTVGFAEQFIETPVTTKRGFIVPVTKEAVFFDRINMVLQRASKVSEWVMVNKEKRVLDLVLGIVNNYRYNEVDYDTYGAASGSRDWTNVKTSNPLTDWTSIEASELIFDAIEDPTTGEPVNVGVPQLIVPSALKHTARRITRATNINHVDNQANASTIRTESANPLDPYTCLSSQYIKKRSGSATTWWHGDFQRAFAYMENWPITSVSAPPSSELEFTHDIVHRDKVSERGVPAVMDPRLVVKNTA